MLIDDQGKLAESPSSGPQTELEPLHLRVSPATNAVVIVAHPDDETLWAGGMILTHPHYNWFIAATCRKNDPDRSRKFFLAMHNYGAKGVMADLDDGPEQRPLEDGDVQQSLLRLLPTLNFDLILSHAPCGEYTRHRRHEEVSQAVMALWQSRVISAEELWLFAYEDDHGRRLPQAIETAHHFEALPETVRQEKYRLITEVYGFDPESWEARSVPQNEAFWRFNTPAALQSWLDRPEADR
jgi:LmbE family N-acetylglucosaminyl deacetylase